MAARFAVVITLTLASAAVADSELKSFHWTIQGKRRDALIAFPDAARKTPAPVVFFFHGHGGTAEGFAEKVNISKVWPEAIGVFMQGIPTPSRIDPKGKKAGWQSLPETENDRDLKFFDAVLELLHKKHTIDDDRIYASGHSNGGAFTYVLFAVRSDVVAACAPIAGSLRVPEKTPLKPVPVLHIAGEQDKTSPYETQLQTMARVRAINGCKGTGTEWGKGTLLYEPKTKSGAPFVGVIHPAGHTVPPHAFPTIVKFFKENPRHAGRD